MGLHAVCFDNQALLLPQEVNLEAMAIDLHLDVASWARKPRICDSRKQPRLHGTSQSRQPFVLCAPGGKDRAELRSAAMPPAGKQAIHLLHIQ